MDTAISQSQHQAAEKLGGKLEDSPTNKGRVIGTINGQTVVGSNADDALGRMQKVYDAANPKPDTGGAAETSPTPATPKQKKTFKPKKAAVAKAPAVKKPKAAKSKKKSEDGEDEEGDGKSVIAAKYKTKYKPHKSTCGDDFVKALAEATSEDEGVSIKLLDKVAKDNGLTIQKWMHLQNKSGSVNVGMIRMNLGNVLRGMVRKGTDVKIGGKTFKGAKQPEKAVKKAG